MTTVQFTIFSVPTTRTNNASNGRLTASKVCLRPFGGKDFSKSLQSISHVKCSNQREAGGLRMGKMTPLLLFLALILFAAGGCAPGGVNSVTRMLDSVGNMSVARHYLGEPHVSRKMTDGGTLYEWSMDRVERESAHYETRRVLIGHDRDGFPVFEDIDYFIPERDVRQTCRITVLADASDNIREHNSSGTHCGLMYRVPVNY